ncbi:hypothetical protein FNH22_30730 [Fulvivirga sp. M361]|uniref:hypothetical protein n=1 Tax=Fulvivirga sp. M361 TaxID=2594266 RepID=UPI001179CA58|nr:hypothetical protein [Fulvivirga sp. M361]TRX46486.1 hypothetical protein FNH22_30730 [Fulvivirga sp. M361]
MTHHYNLIKSVSALICALVFYTTANMCYAQSTFSINKTVSVIHIIEDDNRFTQAYEKLTQQVDNTLPEEYFRNPIKENIYVTAESIPTDQAGFVHKTLQENKVPNKVLNYLFQEKEGALSIDLLNQRMQEVASDNTLSLSSLTTLDAETSVQREYLNRVLNTNYVLVIHHHGLSRLDDVYDKRDSINAVQYATDSAAYPARLKEYEQDLKKYSEERSALLKEAQANNIPQETALEKLRSRPEAPIKPVKTKVVRRERGFTIQRNAYLYKLSLGDSIINNDFWENGWADQSNSEEQKSEAHEYRNELTIPLHLKENVVKTVRSTMTFDEKGQRKMDRSKITGSLTNFKDVLKTDLSGNYNEDTYFKRLKDLYVPATALKETTKGLKEFKTSSAIFATKPIQVKIGRQQGLKVNHRYDVLRRTVDKQTGQVKSKRIGSILATTFISDGTRGENGRRQPSKFIQLQGKQLDLGDQVVENRIPVSAYGGFSSDGLVGRLDIYIPPLFKKLKYGQKLYLDLFYDNSDQPGGMEEITINGENFKTNVSVFSVGLGISKEWYFLKRFIIGPLMGLRYYQAQFKNEQVAERFVAESSIDDYGKDLAFEVGARFGIRLTHDLSLIASGSYTSVDFNAPFADGNGQAVFDSDEGRFPLEGYRSHVELTLRYDFQRINYKK